MSGIKLSESITEKYSSIIGETVEYLSISEMTNESLFESDKVFEHTFIGDIVSIDEGAVVTFDKKTYPRDGWCVLLAGGAGLVI